MGYVGVEQIEICLNMCRQQRLATGPRRRWSSELYMRACVVIDLLDTYFLNCHLLQKIAGVQLVYDILKA